MKQKFEEPNVILERFIAADQIMTVSWIPGLGEDETNPFGGLSPIGSN